MKLTKIFFLILCTILFSQIVSAVYPFIPTGDIDGVGIRGIRNMTTINSSEGFYDDGVLLTPGNLSWNQAVADSLYIALIEEGNINGNSSVYWYTVKGPINNFKSRWFFRDGNYLDYDESRLNDTIDLRASGNTSFNQSTTNKLYATHDAVRNNFTEAEAYTNLTNETNTNYTNALNKTTADRISSITPTNLTEEDVDVFNNNLGYKKEAYNTSTQIDGVVEGLGFRKNAYNESDLNATQLKEDNGKLTIIVSWLRSLFYTKTEVDTRIVDNITESEAYTMTLINENFTVAVNTAEAYTNLTNISNTDYTNWLNTTQQLYIDAKDVAFNLSMKSYVDYLNQSMNDWVSSVYLAGVTIHTLITDNRTESEAYIMNLMKINQTITDGNITRVENQVDDMINRSGDIFNAKDTQYNFSFLNESLPIGLNNAVLKFRTNESLSTMVLSVGNDGDSQINIFSAGTNATRGVAGSSVDNATGISAVNADLRFIVQEVNRSFIFQQWNGTELVDSMIIQEDGTVLLNSDLFFEDRNKTIRTVPVDGGAAMLFQSEEILEAGGFPFIWVARSSDGDQIVPSWLQNGNNNSYSGNMNSFGTVPQTWVTFSGMGDEGGIDFLFNVSNYLNYCDWLQTNLSLIPDGCQYAADTTGRGVPLLFGGDLEVHRTATIHELLRLFDGILATGDADFVMEGNQFDVFNGSVHVSTPVIYEAGFSEGDALTKLSGTFPGILSPFANQQSDFGDWVTTSSGFCEDSPCAAANGGGSGVVEMMANFNTIDSENCTLNFTYSNDDLRDAPEEIVVTMNNGNASGEIEVYSDATKDVILQDVSIILDNGFADLSSVNLSYTCYSSKDNRLCYVDSVNVQCFATTTTLSNQSGFDSNYCTSDGGLDVNDQCNTGIVYDAATDTHLMKGTWNVTGTVVGGVTGTGTSNTVSKWTGTTSQGNSNILDDGSLVTINSDTTIVGDLVDYIKNAFNKSSEVDISQTSGYLSNSAGWINRSSDTYITKNVLIGKSTAENFPFFVTNSSRPQYVFESTSTNDVCILLRPNGGFSDQKWMCVDDDQNNRMMFGYGSVTGAQRTFDYTEDEVNFNSHDLVETGNINMTSGKKICLDGNSCNSQQYYNGTCLIQNVSGTVVSICP